MVGSSNGTSLPAPSPGLPPPAQLLPFPPGMDPSQWGWNRPRASGMRPGFMQGGPRRGAPYLSRGPGFFPGHRGPPPQQQAYFNQRKPPRPNWVPRLLRLPHFPANPADPNFANYQPPANWPSQTPPSAPSPATSEDDKNQGEHSQPPKKKKRTTNGTSRPWDRVAAELALKTELDYKKNAGSNALVVKFPDPELSKEIVQRYNSAIDNVHFQGPCSSRYCFVTLKEGANVEQTMKELSEIEFGTGHLTVERKVEKAEENVKPEDIDPYTLFIGNLPANISTLQVKEKFPTALRIDVGYAQKMKYTRYAFARYSSTETALEAYKTSINTIIASRSIVLRFRRNNAPVGPPGEKPTTAVVDVKPGEKLTVGAKLEAKRKKAKREKVQRDKELGCYNSDDDSDDDDRVSLEDDDTDSECVENDGDEEVGDDTDDDGVEESDDEDDDVEDEPVKREPVEDDDDSASDNEAADVCTGTGYIGEDSDDRASDDDEEAMKDGEFFNLLRRKQK